MKKIGFIGTGKMAQALITAILGSNLVKPQDIICSDVSAELLDKAGKDLGVATTCDNAKVFAQADIVFLAFKPQNFPAAVTRCCDDVRDDQVIVSIMAGITIDKIRRVLPGRVVRVMPNTACLVGQMAAGFAAADNVTDEQLGDVGKILACAGSAMQVEESLIDAVTGLSGSGPAFAARIMDYFIKAGVNAGLKEEIARELTLKTFSGTAALLSEWQMPCEQLIQMVSSPNGTTVAGREVLESSDIAEVIDNTVKRAAQRSKELGQ